MKLIVAIIHPEQLTAVQAALNKRGVQLMTVSEVLDCGAATGATEIYRGREFRRPVAKLRLEITVPDPFLDATLAALERAADSLHMGDVTVYVMGLANRDVPASGIPESVACSR
ncbi:hypothetical protein AYO44_07350 [Planctomycetaceae bacterium SCGC AG-212-F19]|nr:hypothetical protein AYO44_07350 [Planctomycetaceae bacterium SCGC AG-212-F19]